jgi:hypothetical protein
MSMTKVSMIIVLTTFGIADPERRLDIFTTGGREYSPVPQRGD